MSPDHHYREIARQQRRTNELLEAVLKQLRDLAAPGIASAPAARETRP
jgi:hypothetical protein